MVPSQVQSCLKPPFGGTGSFGSWLYVVAAEASVSLGGGIYTASHLVNVVPPKCVGLCPRHEQQGMPHNEAAWGYKGMALQGAGAALHQPGWAE